MRKQNGKQNNQLVWYWHDIGVSQNEGPIHSSWCPNKIKVRSTISIWNIRVFSRIFATHDFMNSKGRPKNSGKKSLQEIEITTVDTALVSSIYPVRRCLGSQNSLQNRFQKGLEHMGYWCFRNFGGPSQNWCWPHVDPIGPQGFVFYSGGPSLGVFLGEVGWAFLKWLEVWGSLEVVFLSDSHDFVSKVRQIDAWQKQQCHFSENFSMEKIQFMAINSFFLVHRLRWLESSTLLGWKAWFSVWELLSEIQCKTPPGMYTTETHQNLPPLNPQPPLVFFMFPLEKLVLPTSKIGKNKIRQLPARVISVTKEKWMPQTSGDVKNSKPAKKVDMT